MIYVADAIMGSGKTSAAINFMNSHPDRKYLYVTPYIDETSRILSACPSLNFIAPHAAAEFCGSKVRHTACLLKEGYNITTTHQAFKLYSQDMKDDIRRLGYTLILDESLDTLSEINIPHDDINLFVESGYVEESAKGKYHCVKDSYAGRMYNEFFGVLCSRDIVRVGGKKNSPCFYWEFPPDLFAAFRDVYILTYMFKAQNLSYLFDMTDTAYKYIYVNKTEDGYVFDEYNRYIPEYVYHIKDKLHILENVRYNRVGDRFTALSESWFKNDNKLIPEVRDNVYNFFRNHSPSSTDRRLWSTYSCSKNILKGKGYTKRFLAFNTRATNDYSSSTHLAYCVNIFMNLFAFIA